MTYIKPHREDYTEICHDDEDVSPVADPRRRTGSHAGGLYRRTDSL